MDTLTIDETAFLQTETEISLILCEDKNKHSGTVLSEITAQPTGIWEDIGLAND